MRASRRTRAAHEPDACAQLAGVVDRLGGLSGRVLLVELGLEVAGVPRSGPGVALALLHGGRTRLVGGGFHPDLRDHTGSQARHFAGIARSVTVLGPRRTTWLSEHVRRDARDSPDGRLTLLAVRFASGLLDGSLPPDDAGDWIRRHLCGR